MSKEPRLIETSIGNETINLLGCLHLSFLPTATLGLLLRTRRVLLPPEKDPVSTFLDLILRNNLHRRL